MEILPRDTSIKPSEDICFKARLTASLALPMERARLSFVIESVSEPVSADSSRRKAAIL